MSTGRAVRGICATMDLSVQKKLAAIALRIADACAAGAERMTGASKWWIDVEKWLTSECRKPFAEIRAARKAAERSAWR